MTDYDLYYWPLPFRGEFIRALMAFAGKTWDEHDAGEITQLMQRTPDEQPIPFMGPPVLIERASGFALSEMPAIAFYLARQFGLLPADDRGQALTLKVINDANDVIDELTLDGGREMWTSKKWAEFEPRLQRWMGFWETLGNRHGLTGDAGFLLGGERPLAADIVTATLWTTMRDRLPKLGAMLDDAAPHTAALCRRISGLPQLEALSRTSYDLYGEAYCGGEIEKSLRAVLNE